MTIDGQRLPADLFDTEPDTVPRTTERRLISFRIKRFIFALLLERAATVVPTRDVMEVLKNVQIEARPGRLRVTATDMELSIIATTEIVTVDQPGTVVIPARKLLDIVRQADADEVVVRVVNTNAGIILGRTVYNLRLQSGEDYPVMPAVTEAVMAPVDRVAFAAALHAVRYAACKESNRANLMMIDVHEGRLTACDGSRFQQATLGPFPFDFQLPIGAVDDLLKLLTKTDLAEISIGQSDNHLIFRLGGDMFIVNKLTARFPDMEATLLRPALANRHRLTVDRVDLLTAVKRVRITADTETSAIALRLAPGTLDVSSRDKYGNQATETVTADWAGPERTIVVNHTFLTDMITAHPRQALEFRLGDDTKTRKTPVMLQNTDAGTVGVLQQMVADWVGSP